MGGQGHYLNCLLITANVGSIFEDPEHTLKQWLKEFFKAIENMAPSFIALHCQEVGGKNYEESMQHVEAFVKALLSSKELSQFRRCRVYLDEDFTAEDKFTALGNLYFVHDSVKKVRLWNFPEGKFEDIDDIEVLSGSIEEAKTKEKLKFPVQYFPDQKWSRKGYLRTRWNIGNQVFDLFNIHLFHDASNIAAMEKSPSQYSKYRRNAFDFVLDRVKNEDLPEAPQFIFGDFNFRLDSHQLVNKLTEKLEVEKTTNTRSGKLAKLEFKASDEVVLTVEPKGFEHHQHDELFFSSKSVELLEYDTETQPFSKDLSEYPITFPPSYPFSEDVANGTSYMKTRCPSWCDRILFNSTAKNIITHSRGLTPTYNTIGQDICMGDHKPVYLHVQLKLGSAEEDDTGNNNSVTTELHSTSDCLVDVVTHEKLSRKISINGERIAQDNLDNASLLHNATFACERSLSPEIMQKMSEHRGFKNVASYVMQAGRSLSAWLNVPNQNSSDEESEEEEDCNGNINVTARDVTDQPEHSASHKRVAAEPSDDSSSGVPQKQKKV